MKTQCVTSFTKKNSVLVKCNYHWKSILFFSLPFIVISCSGSDDTELILVDPPEASVIIYTDIEPDATYENQNGSYNLDLDNDQRIDYIIKRSDIDEEWLEIASSPDVQNGIISDTPWYQHPVAMREDALIFTIVDNINGRSYETAGFFSIGYCFPGEVGCAYDWKVEGDRYLGLKFWKNNQIHYGWARMEIKSLTEWVIKDYAYNAAPNKPVYAGKY